MLRNKGLKYFMNLCTLNCDDDKEYMILNEDVRKVIWKFANTKLFLECYVCNKILVLLELNVEEDIITENLTLLNGISKCSEC